MSDPTLAELQANTLAGFASLREAMEYGFAQVYARMDSRFAQVDSRFDKMDAQLDRVENRLDRMETKFDRMETRIEDLETKRKRR